MGTRPAQPHLLVDGDDEVVLGGTGLEDRRRVRAGRPVVRDGAESRPRQIGVCTLPVALTQPVLERISQASTPVVPPISAIDPLGRRTVTVQPWPELWVAVPPGQFSIVFEGELTMWNVSRPDGQPE